MWLIDKWEAWSRRAYDLWGSKLQEKYNFWDEYDNPELRKKCKMIWEGLPVELQKKLYGVLTEVLKKYGPEFAKRLVEKLTEAFVHLVGN